MQIDDTVSKILGRVRRLKTSLFTIVCDSCETYVIIMSGEEASAGDKPNFAGKYALVRNENFDDFLAANGMMLRLLFVLGRFWQTRAFKFPH